MNPCMQIERVSTNKKRKLKQKQQEEHLIFFFLSYTKKWHNVWLIRLSFNNKKYKQKIREEKLSNKEKINFFKNRKQNENRNVGDDLKGEAFSWSAPPLFISLFLFPRVFPASELF